MPNTLTTSSERSTRERILEATVALMAEVGIDRVRTRAVAERAGVNPGLVHYHFGSMSALVLEAAEHALIHELGPSIDALASGSTIQDGIVAILAWIEDEGRTPGSTILAEAMVKSTRDPAFRDWSMHASRRFRALILERLQVALDAGEIDRSLDLGSTAVLLAAALDGLLFHRLVDPELEVLQTHALFESMLRPRAPAGPTVSPEALKRTPQRRG
jgi:AcrR family transcriptional regulator